MRFFGIDAQDFGQFPRIARALRKLAPGILDKFYAKIAATPETAGFFPTQTMMNGAKDAELAHWTNLFGGGTAGIPNSYFEQANRIGSVHARVGLAPTWYIGGYATCHSAITDFSRQQAGNLDQLNGTVTALDTSSQSNATAAEQAAGVSQRLAEQSASLAALVRRFRPDASNVAGSAPRTTAPRISVKPLARPTAPAPDQSARRPAQSRTLAGATCGALALALTPADDWSEF
jgi:methyl-accepting chemotaxis protein